MRAGSAFAKRQKANREGSGETTRRYISVEDRGDAALNNYLKRYFWANQQQPEIKFLTTKSLAHISHSLA